ncbi:MAG: YcfL family protein [Oleiphilus sp.]
MKQYFVKEKVGKFLSIAGLCAVLGACAVNETATVVVEDGQATQIIETNNGVLADSLRISNTHIGYAGDLLKVQAAITNDSDDHLNFRYKFKWLDKNGFEIAIDGRPWTPMTISPYETKNVQAIAPNPTANSFKILVQN